jgi:hypothetical protein
MRRGKQFIASTESFLVPKLRGVPPHTRVYFAGVPVRSVFVLGPGDTPALNVWTADSTLRGYYWSQFRARGEHEAAGPDRFFRRDSLSGWREVVLGPERYRPDDPDWRSDHEAIVPFLIDGGDVAAARIECEKLAAADPRRADYAFLAGSCAEILGDTAAAAAWYGRAAALPGADAEMVAKAREFPVR